MKKAILLICLTIFLFMSLQTWDGLQKNATDDETIEQAIERLIGVHEGDSTSHLGVGESLQAHKNADVIDHPADSIVSDKFSQTDKPFYTYYENPSFFTTEGHASGSFLYYNIYVLGNDVQDSYSYNPSIYFSNDDNDDPLDCFLDYNFYINNSYNVGTIYLGLNVQDSVPSLDMFLGIKIVNKVVYYGFANGGAITWDVGPTLVNSVKHVVRFATNSIDKSAEIWLDGVLVKSYALGDSAAWTVTCFGVYIDKIGGTLGSQRTSIISKYLIFYNPKF